MDIFFNFLLDILDKTTSKNNMKTKIVKQCRQIPAMTLQSLKLHHLQHLWYD